MRTRITPDLRTEAVSAAVRTQSSVNAELESTGDAWVKRAAGAACGGAVGKRALGFPAAEA